LVESVHTMFAMFLELRDQEQKELDFFAKWKGANKVSCKQFCRQN
jgi:hypothetical protein